MIVLADDCHLRTPHQHVFRYAVHCIPRGDVISQEVPRYSSGLQLRLTTPTNE
jgi:hypothetical protein